SAMSEPTSGNTDDSALRFLPWPPDALAQHTEERGNDDRSHDERVDDHADSDDEPELTQRHQWQYAQRGEYRRKHDTCARDDGASVRDRTHHALAGPVPGRLSASPVHEEDRVVDAQRD